MKFLLKTIFGQTYILISSSVLTHKPTNHKLTELLGFELGKKWFDLCSLIEKLYETEKIWSTGGKSWIYEYKYRRGGKTLCTMYAKEKGIGLLIIFGKKERDRFESEQSAFTDKVKEIYKNSITYHDGKWMMIDIIDSSMFVDISKLLYIKRKPNKK